MSSVKYEIQQSDELGRYLVAAKDLKAGEKILSEEALVVGPHGDSSLVCFNCYLPLISKFLCCKSCGVAPVCPGDGCPSELPKWHKTEECKFFAKLKLEGLGAITMVQNVGSLVVLRALLKRQSDPHSWEELIKLETHLDDRRNTDVWRVCASTDKFIESLGLLKGGDKELVQKLCGAVDVNSFEVRGPPIPALRYSETLRGVYLRPALIAHNCVANTHLSINDNNVMTISASTDINKGDTIFYNYTDPLQGTDCRQKHLIIGKYFKCSCRRCCDPTELGTHLSSALCPSCKSQGYVINVEGKWTCQKCNSECQNIGAKVKCCSDKLEVINKKDEKELEEYIRNVSLLLAPNHYLLLDAKQRLAGVLRDTINREPHPTNKLIRRKVELCREILAVLEKLNPGISRTKAITLYELHAAIVQLAKKLFDAREINGSAYLDELISAEKLLKRSLEMLFIEPGNSPEGELCAKALEEYRALKITMGVVLDGIHTEGKTYVAANEDKNTLQTNED